LTHFFAGPPPPFGPFHLIAPPGSDSTTFFDIGSSFFLTPSVFDYPRPALCSGCVSGRVRTLFSLRFPAVDLFPFPISDFLRTVLLSCLFWFSCRIFFFLFFSSPFRILLCCSPCLLASVHPLFLGLAHPFLRSCPLRRHYVRSKKILSCVEPPPPPPQPPCLTVLTFFSSVRSTFNALFFFFLFNSVFP